MSKRIQNTELKSYFHSIYEEYADILFRYAYFKLSDREKAKDIVQDTFVRFWEFIAADGVVEKVKPFLYRIATNAIIDQYRKHKDLSLDGLAEGGFDPADHEGHKKMLHSADGALALELLNKIDSEDREIMLMRYVEGLSVKEIAEIVGDRENTISVKIHRALKDLQDLFEKNDA